MVQHTAMLTMADR